MSVCLSGTLYINRNSFQEVVHCLSHEQNSEELFRLVNSACIFSQQALTNDALSLSLSLYIYIYMEIIDWGESDKMVEICEKLDKSNT